MVHVALTGARPSVELSGSYDGGEADVGEVDDKVSDSAMGE